MSVKWNKPEFDRFRLRVESFGEDAARATVSAIAETIEKGVEDIQYVIHESHTETGRRRAAGGGSAGRVETGAMVNAVESHIAAEGNRYVSGTFGWLNDSTRGHQHAYFQEHGTAQVDGMNAIFQAYSLAIGNFRRSLIEKGFVPK